MKVITKTSQQLVVRLESWLALVVVSLTLVVLILIGIAIAIGLVPAMMPQGVAILILLGFAALLGFVLISLDGTELTIDRLRGQLQLKRRRLIDGKAKTSQAYRLNQVVAIARGVTTDSEGHTSFQTFLVLQNGSTLTLVNQGADVTQTLATLLQPYLRLSELPDIDISASLGILNNRRLKYVVTSPQERTQRIQALQQNLLQEPPSVLDKPIELLALLNTAGLWSSAEEQLFATMRAQLAAAGQLADAVILDLMMAQSHSFQRSPGQAIKFTAS